MPAVAEGGTTMSYKDLLIQVDDTRGCAGRIELAVALAVAH